MISKDHLSPSTSRAELIGQTERQSIASKLFAIHKFQGGNQFFIEKVAANFFEPAPNI
jgi:hypothetical protein